MLTICTTDLVRTVSNIVFTSAWLRCATRATRHVEMWSYLWRHNTWMVAGKSSHGTWQILVFQAAIKSVLLDQVSFWKQTARACRFILKNKNNTGCIGTLKAWSNEYVSGWDQSQLSLDRQLSSTVMHALSSTLYWFKFWWESMIGLTRLTGHASCTRVVESCRSKRFSSHYP